MDVASLFAVQIFDHSHCGGRRKAFCVACGRRFLPRLQQWYKSVRVKRFYIDLLDFCMVLNIYLIAFYKA